MTRFEKFYDFITRIIKNKADRKNYFIPLKQKTVYYFEDSIFTLEMESYIFEISWFKVTRKLNGLHCWKIQIPFRIFNVTVLMRDIAIILFSLLRKTSWNEKCLFKFYHVSSLIYFHYTLKTKTLHLVVRKKIISCFPAQSQQQTLENVRKYV